MTLQVSLTTQEFGLLKSAPILFKNSVFSARYERTEYEFLFSSGSSSILLKHERDFHIR
jgi:hypothetical protein